MFILALQCFDYFVGLIWLEVHFQVINDVVIWRCRKTKVDFGVRVVGVFLYKIDPASERDVCMCTAIRVVEICSSRALRCVVELDEEKIKWRLLYRIRQMGVRNYALWILEVSIAYSSNSRASTPRCLSRFDFYIKRGKMRLRKYIRGAAET